MVENKARILGMDLSTEPFCENCNFYGSEQLLILLRDRIELLCKSGLAFEIPRIEPFEISKPEHATLEFFKKSFLLI